MSGRKTKQASVFAWYLSLREKGISGHRQVARGLHRLLKLTSDVVLTWTWNPLLGNRFINEVNETIFVLECSDMLWHNQFLFKHQFEDSGAEYEEMKDGIKRGKAEMYFEFQTKTKGAQERRD